MKFQVMIPLSDTVLTMITKIVKDCCETTPKVSLPKTHVESINADVDGVCGHFGMDGDWYYRFCSDGKTVTVGMNLNRLLDIARRMFSFSELSSLAGVEADKTTVKRRTGAFYVNMSYYIPNLGEISGDMGYLFGGDYDESRVDFELAERDKTFKKMKDELVKKAVERKSYDEKNKYENICCYIIEEHRYESCFNEDGEKIEDEEIKEKHNCLMVVSCSEEKAVETGLKAFLDNAEGQFKIPYIFVR